MVTHTCDYANALVLLLFCSPSLALSLRLYSAFLRCADHTRACVSSLSRGSPTASSDERRRSPAIDLAQRQKGDEEKKEGGGWISRPWPKSFARGP
jgi:hypothetical protein